jgi:ubiquinol-cytochrome c reductase cytochrome c subunit
MKLSQLRAAVVGVAIASMPVNPTDAQTKTSPPVEAPATAPAGSAANGKVLYGKIGCYQCHSEQGQGGTQGPRLGPRPIAFQAFLRYVRSPRGEMPPYKAKVMSDKDVADVYAFLQALPPPPPLASLPLLQP